MAHTVRRLQRFHTLRARRPSHPPAQSLPFGRPPVGLTRRVRWPCKLTSRRSRKPLCRSSTACRTRKTEQVQTRVGQRIFLGGAWASADRVRLFACFVST